MLKSDVNKKKRKNYLLYIFKEAVKRRGITLHKIVLETFEPFAKIQSFKKRYHLTLLVPFTA